jgi:glycosyltransferase involved in cell wall biosynthesis
MQLAPKWPVIWDAVDYLSPLYEQAARASTSLPMRFVSRLEAPRLAAYERWLTSQFQSTIVISTTDLVLFQRENPFAERVHLALTGIPMLPIPEAETRATNVLVITGTLNYHPNVASVLYFANEILPLIQREQPDIQLQLVGANPVPAIQALQSESMEVTGFVPSITDYLNRATIALAPVVYGSGMQIKVLEAFQTATPLVVTSVALRGLDVRHEEQVLIADTPADFSAAVLRLLADPALRARLGAAGRAYVQQNHNLITTTQHLVEIYQRVIVGG